MFAVKKSVLIAGSSTNNSRNFWAWLNIIFNRVDTDRIKEVGPDRACAEWLLRNGAQVTFAGEEPTKDYNGVARLPSDSTKKLIEIDASEASITCHGFGHLKGCKHVQTIKFHKNSYLNDAAVGDLSAVKESLRNLHISSCEEVTDEGVTSCTQLRKLSNLTLLDLIGVKDWDKRQTELQNALPTCQLILNKQPVKAPAK